MSSSPDAPRPLKRLPPLLRRAWYGLNQTFRQRVAHLNLTPDQYSILRWLTEGDAAGLTQRQITELMASDPNTITSTLSRMEKAGMICRNPHEKDRRANRVQVLPEGRRVFEQAWKVAFALQEQVLSALPEGRREGFLNELEARGNRVRKPAGRGVEAALALSRAASNSAWRELRTRSPWRAESRSRQAR